MEPVGEGGGERQQVVADLDMTLLLSSHSSHPPYHTIEQSRICPVRYEYIAGLYIYVYTYRDSVTS